APFRGIARALERAGALPRLHARRVGTPPGDPMNPAPLDWAIVVLSIAVCFLPALWMMRRGGSSAAEFFASGRSAPWWLIGVSMVATTFSTDTPNLVTNFVRTGGVASNWQWWAFLLTGM